ncbi:MAG TPA: DUF481 domain-containing protein [Polyangia bacterium]
MPSVRRCSVSLALAALLVARAAPAQTEPKFTFAKPEEQKPAAPPVEWKVQAKGGFNLTSGNSQTTNATAGLTASRKEGNNRLGLDGGIAYGRSNIYVATIGPDPMMPTNTAAITDLTRQEVTTTNNWFTKGRYDRFFTTNNSGYVSGLAAADKIAGKTFAGGGQIGYSRQLVKTDNNTLVAEVGYDFSYESYVQLPMKTLDPVSIHSARLFVGETAKITSATGATASVEAFFNLNKEGKALNVDPPHDPGVAAFHDTRVIGKLGVSTTLFKSLSAALGFTIRYDQNPAPLPVPPGAMGMAFDPTFQPFAEKVDTLTEASLIYTFL